MWESWECCVWCGTPSDGSLGESHNPVWNVRGKKPLQSLLGLHILETVDQGLWQTVFQKAIFTLDPVLKIFS